LLSYEWIRSKVELSALGVGGIRVETNPRTESPIVSGVLLNPLYFTHGACVMQGVDDLDKIFAMPLLGVEELSFWPTAEGIDPATVTWTIEEITEPQGISAEIQNDTLYIWGSDPSWAGYGEVTLSATAAGGASGTVTIPVTVFRDDRTLVNNKGKKEYYIPWGVELDINRIVSVEEHMRQYDKEDLGLLDRTLRFSRYKVMEELRDVDLSTQWFIEGGDHSWPNTPSLL
jgi:hypothetical protein